MKKTKNPDRFVEIDIDEIDQDLADQPNLYLKWARKAADARFDLDEAEAELELTKAEVDAAIRKDPKKHGFSSKDKPTEPAIKQAIPQQQEYQDSLRAVNEARKALGHIQAALGALDNKKRSLSDLVTLISLSWFAEPRIKAHAKEAKRQLDQSVRKGYRRRKE